MSLVKSFKTNYHRGNYISQYFCGSSCRIINVDVNDSTARVEIAYAYAPIATLKTLRERVEQEEICLDHLITVHPSIVRDLPIQLLGLSDACVRSNYLYDKGIVYPVLSQFYENAQHVLHQCEHKLVLYFIKAIQYEGLTTEKICV